MIALDTNLLVYAHREDSPWHARAERCVREQSEGRSPWALAWTCIHEFLAIVTHPRIYNPPTPHEAAIAQVDAWLGSPQLVLLAESAGYWDLFRREVLGARVEGPVVHDARVASLCIANGIDELWTADRDFSRFGGLKTRNPLV